MATDSFPARGTGGFTIGEWAAAHAANDGIINDFMSNSKQACSLTVDNGSNTVTISPGQVSVDGYILDIISDTALSCPAVGSGTVTYTIAAQYDPALNVAAGGGVASALGPCRLQIFNGTLPTGGGEKYFTLYVGSRTVSQALSAVAWVDYRNWIGPVLSGPNVNQNLTLTPSSRGTLRIQTDVNGTADQVNLSLRTVNAAGTALEWQGISLPPVIAFPAASGLVAESNPAQIVRESAWVNLRGTLKRSNNTNLNTGSNVTLGTLPAGHRPLSSFRVGCLAGPTFGWAVLNIQPDGTVFMYPTPFNCAYVQLDNIRFRAQ